MKCQWGQTQENLVMVDVGWMGAIIMGAFIGGMGVRRGTSKMKDIDKDKLRDNEIVNRWEESGYQINVVNSIQ